MPPSPRQKLNAAQRRKKALSLWLAGVDYRTIAEQVDYANASSVKKAIDRAIAESVARDHEDIDQMRRLEVMRWDRLQAGHWANAVHGDTKAADVVAKCMVGRERLLGLAAPQRVSIEAQELGDQIMALINQATGVSGAGDGREPH